MGRGQVNIPLKKLDEYRWCIPRSYMKGMHVDGRIYADENLMKSIRTDQSLQQVANVAHLPGIVKYSLAMPTNLESFAISAQIVPCSISGLNRIRKVLSPCSPVPSKNLVFCWEKDSEHLNSWIS